MIDYTYRCSDCKTMIRTRKKHHESEIVRDGDAHNRTFRKVVKGARIFCPTCKKYTTAKMLMRMEKEE